MDTINILGSNNEESVIKEGITNAETKSDEPIELKEINSSLPVETYETNEKVPNNVKMSSNDESTCFNDLKNSTKITILPTSTSVSVEKSVDSSGGSVGGGVNNCCTRSLGTSTITTNTTTTKNYNIPQQKVGLVSFYKSPVAATTTSTPLTVATTPNNKIVANVSNPASKMAIIRRIKSKFQKKPTSTSIKSILPSTLTKKPVLSTVVSKPSTQAIVFSSNTGDIVNNSTKLSVNIPNSITISKTLLNPSQSSSSSSSSSTTSPAISPNIVHHSIVTAPNTITITNTSATKYTASSLSSFTTTAGGISFVSAAAGSILTNKIKPTVTTAASSLSVVPTTLPIIKKIDHSQGQTTQPPSVLQIRKISTKTIVPGGAAGVGVNVTNSPTGGILFKSILTKSGGNLPKISTSQGVVTTASGGVGPLKVIIAKPTVDKPSSPNNPLIKLNSMISPILTTGTTAVVSTNLPITATRINFTQISSKELGMAKLITPTVDGEKSNPPKIEQKLPMRPATVASTVSKTSSTMAGGNINKMHVQRPKSITTIGLTTVTNTITTAGVISASAQSPQITNITIPSTKKEENTSIHLSKKDETTTIPPSKKDDLSEHPRVYLPSSFLNRQIMDNENKNQKVFSIGAVPNIGNQMKKLDAMYNIKISNGKLSDPKGPIRMLSVQNIDKINANTSTTTQSDSILIEDDDNLDDKKRNEVVKPLTPTTQAPKKPPQTPPKEQPKKPSSGNIISLINKTTTINLSPGSLKRKFVDQKSVRLQSRSKSVCLAELINSAATTANNSGTVNNNSSSILSPSKKRRIRRIRLPTSPGTVSKLYALKTISAAAVVASAVTAEGTDKNSVQRAAPIVGINEENSIENEWVNSANDSLTCEEEIDDVSEKSKSLSPISSTNKTITELATVVPEATMEVTIPEVHETVEITTEKADTDDDDDEGKLVMDIANDPAPIPDKESTPIETVTVTPPTTPAAISIPTSSSTPLPQTIPETPSTTNNQTQNTQPTPPSTDENEKDPINYIKWRLGIGYLFNSKIHFKTNEFNLVEILNENDFKNDHVDKKFEKTLNDDLLRSIFSSNIYKAHNPQPAVKPMLSVISDASMSQMPSDNLGIVGSMEQQPISPSSSSAILSSKNHNDGQKQIGRKNLLPASRLRAVLRNTASSSSYATAQLVNKIATFPSSSSIANNNTTTTNNDQLQFSWNLYIKMTNTTPAPKNMFINPFPSSPNMFEVGMKLEAIDPEHNSLFCVCTIVQRIGYRIKLRFDGYNTKYDFWKNADSLDIFPPGWCSKTGRDLQPPAGYDGRKFEWSSYLIAQKALAAPRIYFTHLNSSATADNPFKIGMKLEADDLKNSRKICVATVGDVLDNRILIQFDGWDGSYDYWTDITSPYIHPINWHMANGFNITGPPDYKSPFKWDTYLRNTNSIAAPENIFCARQPMGFWPGLQLEIVDKKNPSLIRPASIVAVDDYELKVLFIGWSSSYAYWTDDDSTDIHPINWCSKTDHPIETPNIGVYSLTKYHSSCGVDGCREIGNAKRPHVPMHFTLAECPYELQNWTTECPQKTDRLKDVRIIDRKSKQLKRCYAVEKVTNNIKSNINTGLGGEFNNDGNCVGLPMTKRIKIERLSFDETNSSMGQLPTSTHGGGNKSLESTSAGGGGDSINNDEFDFHVKEEIINDDTLTESILTPSVILTEPSQADDDQQETTENKSKRSNNNNRIGATAAAINNKTLTTAMIKENIELAKRLEISEKLLRNYGPNIKEMHKLWKNNTKILEEKISKTKSDKLIKTSQQNRDSGSQQLNPIRWSVTDVVDYVSLIPNCKNIAKKFSDNEINGSAFLCLSQDDLTDLMDMRMGPAVKIYNQIVCLREDVNVNYIKTN